MQILNKEKRYHHTNHLVYSCYYHVVFTPKYRRAVLIDEIAERLEELIYEKQEEYDYKVVECEILPDHVHLLLDVNPKTGVYTVVRKIKGYTSHALREKFPQLKKRLPTLWTQSKFISSCGAVTLFAVKQYLEDQKGK
jgi:putative transposase